ncbi:hypothetical protein KSC_063360 [Ktedonobacter sp. SOSP1-52]|uniref:response regulator n=1 Tax=Ktedonobacter sp. SOSP1-52 TaxID=2778366 RepID=UPI001915AB3D|nr:response regulator [Ktedonobacter sp. SOSP1-52]GHO67444.1 hypothetical protein KSC_063360 [Ktedonobacter sp. SOSP1-52]
MSQDILIVEDDRLFLENLGNEVRLNLDIEPFLADNSQEALNILHDYPIKVLVTDQEMPTMKGVELVRHIREDLKLTIPCIMVTAYPQKLNAFDLVKLQFFGFIDKLNTHAELVQTLRRAIERYDMDEAAKYNIKVDKVLSSRLAWIKFGARNTLKLLRVSSIIDPYIREQDWRTELYAQRNVSSTQEMNISRHVTLSYEYGIDAEVVNKTGLKIGTLVSTVESALEHKFTLSGKIKYEEDVTVEAKQKIEVKEITDTPTSEGLVLQAREYQAAPVYTRVNCVLEIECSCCQVPRSFTASIDLPTNKIALRQVEHFDKGPEKVIRVGSIIQGQFTFNSNKSFNP